MSNRIIPSEYQEQQALIQWSKYEPYGLSTVSDFLIHPANGGYRNKSEAVRLKKMGVKAGVSDLFLALPNEQYHGLWVEMKRRNNGRPTKAQEDWINLMNFSGYKAVVCHGWEEARDVIREYLG